MKQYNSLLLGLYLIGTSLSLTAQQEKQPIYTSKLWKIARVAIPASVSVICAALAYSSYAAFQEAQSKAEFKEIKAGFINSYIAQTLHCNTVSEQDKADLITMLFQNSEQ